jgi:hypothetical protein
MIQFGQGSTIGFSHLGDAQLNLEAHNFKTLFYRKNTVERFEILKSEMTQTAVNTYYGEIPNTLTAIMPAGIYIQEILFGDEFTSVAKATAFTIIETEIR